MSTNDVPGAKSVNRDRLAMGCWAEHEDGSLIFVESVETGTVVYSIFDIAAEPVVEYRDAMPESGFQRRFSWRGKDDVKWTWHDKSAFPWERVMQNFPPGSRHASAAATVTAAQRVARSLDLRAEPLRERAITVPEEEPGVVLALPPRRRQPRCLGCGRWMRSAPVALHDDRCARWHFARATA